MIPRWFTPRVNILLSVLGLIVGLVGTLALNKWWVFVLAAPAVILCLISVERVRNVSCRPNCWLKLGLAQDILATAIVPEQAPPCSQLTVEHSIGVAAAALTARFILTTIIHLRRMLLLLQNEIQSEAVYSLDTLDTHTSALRHIQAIAAGAASRSNFTTQCYLIIPGSSSIVQRLSEVNKSLQDSLLKDIAIFRDGLPKNIDRHMEVSPWKETIKHFFTDKVLPVMTDNLIKLNELSDEARVIVDYLVADWNADIRFLWEDFQCKPIPAEVLPEPKIKVKDVAATSVES